MLFGSRFHELIARGDVTRTIRAWARPQVRIGGAYRVGSTLVEVIAIDQVSVGALSEDDAKRSGFASRGDLLRELEHNSRGRLAELASVYRIDFKVAGAATTAPPAEATVDAIARARTRLANMDASRPEPWTAATLAAIKEHPGESSKVLAALLGRERFELKSDIRRLKAAGLTESLLTGYRLHSLGEAVLLASASSNKDT